MINFAYILMEKDGRFDWIGLVVFIVIAFGATIVKGLKRSAEKAADKRRQEQLTTDLQDSQKPQPRPKPPLRTAQTAAGKIQQNPYAAISSQPRRPSTISQGVDREMRQQQMRLRKAQLAQKKRLEKLKAKKSGLSHRHIEPQIVCEPSYVPETAKIADLSDLQKARQAIIFHEVFSPPKAMRQDGELWEQ